MYEAVEEPVPDSHKCHGHGEDSSFLREPGLYGKRRNEPVEGMASLKATELHWRERIPQLDGRQFAGFAA